MFEHDEEVVPVRFTHYHGDRQRQDSNIMARNLDKLKVGLIEHGILLELLEDCILLRMMLIRAESLEHYKDPEQRKALAEKIKDLLKNLRKESGEEFADVDGIKIHISEEDIEKAEEFFQIGKPGK